MSSEWLGLPEPGQSAELNLRAVRPMRCRVYRPHTELNPERVLVTVHGISRNVHHQEIAFRSMAERLGICLIVPLFDGRYFPGYQRLASDSGQWRADRLLSQLLLSWQAARHLVQLKVHLFGYSGGAQFAHRYAYLYPDRVATLSVCSAGWYTLPTTKVRYPYGLKGWPEWLGKPRTDVLTKLPILGLVGDKDRLRDASLRKTQRLDELQGTTRIERAKCWIDSVNQLRVESDIASHALLQLMPGQAHDFAACAESGFMLPLIEQFIQSHEG